MIRHIIKKILSVSLLSVAALTPAVAQNNSDGHLYVYKNDSVIFRTSLESVDSIALEENKTKVSLYNHESGALIYSAAVSDIDSISKVPPTAPVADLLDIKFDGDGNCWDASQLGLLVSPLNPNATAAVDSNKTYNTWEGHFYSNSWGGAPSSDITCFKVDYSNNDYFKEAIANGHSIECLFKVDYEGDIPDVEGKFFSAHEGGGTGFLICKQASGKNHTNEITFLPNVTTNGKSHWIWATSGVVPKAGQYYHVVGVWNKEEGKAYIYVNGVLCNTVAAEGEFRFPSNQAAQWFGIGCDANTSSGAQVADNHIAIARIYDKALTASDVDALWNNVSELAAVPEADLLDVRFTADGGAEDVSPMKNPVEIVSPTGKIDTYYNAPYGTYAAKINNTWGGKVADTKTYCKVDFENNQKFRDALANGHTVETLWKCTYNGEIPNAEAKWFSAMQGGGTGFLICTQARGKNGTNELTFLPNVTTTGKSNWIWATSGVVPQSEKYYHLVGVWNKEEGKAYVYVNGELMNTVDAAGELKFASKGANWWGIGCDANPKGGEAGGNWEIVTAKVYDDALTEHQVANIWNTLAAETKIADDSVASHQILPEDTVKVPAPTADLMDIQFGPAGQVSDKAIADHNPSWQTITETGEGHVSYFNSDYNCYAAHFSSTPGSIPNDYILAYDYSSDKDFQDSISDGHTIEALLVPNFDQGLNAEIKGFSSHQGGGFGLMVETAGDFTYLPHTGGNYRWATSGVAAKKGQAYHVVGVYDKAAAKARIYVNGELASEVDAPGDFKFSSSMRLIVGADPSVPTYPAEAAWNGDVIKARLYSAPLTTAQVKALYAQLDSTKKAAPKFVTDVSYLDNAAALSGKPFAINGKGFQSGDKIVLVKGDEDMSTSQSVIDPTFTDAGVEIQMPDGIVNNVSYYIYVQRGEQLQTLGLCHFYITDVLPQGTKVIAHRGYWNTTGSAQNSRASLQKAIELGCYGSETDIWLTSDGYLMVNHDPSYNGVTIKTSTYDQCKDLTLSNGEKMPQLSDFLNIIKAENWTTDTTKLIIEIKDHGTDELNEAAAQAAVDAVNEAGVEDRVEYISFSMVACQSVLKADPAARVAYLSGDKSPQEISDAGLTGLDYTLSVFNSNTTWAQDAHDLELTTNVWTIDNHDDIIKVNNMGIDYITTNNPVEALSIQKYYQTLNK